MSNYTKTTDFGAKDSLPTGDSGKIIRGTEFETEFDAISTAIATKADIAGPTFTGTLTYETISDGTISITGFVDEDDMSSDSVNLVPTQQSVKAYVDSQVTAQDLDFQADTGGALSIDLDSETMTFTGGTGIDTSGSGNAVTFAIDSTVATLTGTQTFTNKTLTSPDVNTPDIDGGTIDGTVIGGTTPAAVSATTVSATGNITVGGTVDGRDVATDGTKLDGIESGATADQTAAEIRTLVESATDSNVFTDADHTKLDGIEAGATGDQTNAEIRAAVEAATDSNVFTDADHSKLDGIEALADVTDTTNVTAAGAVMDSELTNETAVKSLDQGVATTDTPTFAGLTTTANVSFGDNDKAIFGAGSDLQIYHDGTHSYVDDSSGTGRLILKTDYLEVQNAAGNEAILGGIQDGAVSLFYDGNTKLATTSTGIDVTGNVVSDGLTVQATGSSYPLIEHSNGNRIQLQPSYNYYNSFQHTFKNLDGSANTLTVGESGDISFYEDTGTTAKLFWDASAESLGIGTTSPSASLELNVPTGDGLLINSADIGTIKMTLASGSQKNWGFATTNLAAGDFGLYQSNSNGGDPITAGTAKLYINSSGNVGIGTSSFTSTASGRTVLEVNGSSASALINLSVNGTRQGYIFTDTTDMNVYNVDSGSLNFGTNNTERMRIDSSGNVGIGVTPESHYTGYTALDLGVSSSVFGNTTTADTNVLGIANNAYLNSGATNWIYKETDEATRYTQSNGTHVWHYAASGTAGTAISWSEAMRLDSSGNVGIGVTNVGAPLDIGTSNPKLRLTDSDGGYSEVRGNGGVITLTADAGNAVANSAIAFETDGSEAMRIDASGNVGIGTSSPAYKAQISDSGNTVLSVTSGDSSSASLYLGDSVATRGRLTYDNSNDSLAVYTDNNERMRLDASGNLLVGTTNNNVTSTSGNNPGINIGVAGIKGFMAAARYQGPPLSINRLGNDGDIQLFSKDGTTVGSIGVEGSDLTIGTGDTGLQFRDASDAIRPFNISTNAARDANIDLGRSSERFRDLYLSGTANTGRIKADDGSLGNTGITDCDVQIIRNGTSNIGLRTVSNGEVIRFVHTSTDVGSIDITTSATSYNTSSDYRLKENVVAMTGATERLKQLAPKRFNFIADADTTVDGFLAHEVQAVVPEAITGVKDAMRDEQYEVMPAVLDDDGNVVTEAVMGTRSVPDYQGIDQSKLVPLLVATIQELEARIAALESN